MQSDASGIKLLSNINLKQDKSQAFSELLK